MNPSQAATVLEVVQAGWSWEMSVSTYQLWQNSIMGWDDAEAAEIAAIELVSQLTRRPNLGEIHSHYQAVVRRLAAERPRLSRHDPALPSAHVVLPATPGLAWSPEGAMWAVGAAEGRVRDGVMYEGEAQLATLREPDVIAAEQRAKDAYVGLGATSMERFKCVIKTLHALVDRKKADA